MIKTHAAAGSWQSRLRVEDITSGFSGYSHTIYGCGDWLIWSESRPQEKGRSQILARNTQGRCFECLPLPMSATTKAHEYGGGAWCVDNNSTTVPIIYFVNDGDGGLYRVVPGEKPRLLWQKSKCWLADLHATDGVVFAVCEDHGAPGEPKASVRKIAEGNCTTLLEGDDFYGSLAISDDGTRMACISWMHPAMPWDSTKLHLLVSSHHQVIAHPQPCAMQQPGFTRDGSLICIADLDGWWQFCRCEDGLLHPLLDSTQTQGREAGLPLWQFGMRSYDYDRNGSLLVAHNCGDRSVLSRINPQNGSMQDLNLPFTNFSGLRIIRDHEGNRGTRFVAIASHTSQFAQIIAIDNAQYRVLRASPPLALDQDDVAKAQAITFATGDDALPLSQWPDAALCAPKYPLPTQAQAFFYLPTNTRFALSEGEKPPLIVKCHGGPTGCSDASLHLKTQFFTSRGFAVLDVNYRGSTGFGRAYREALYGQWGIVDVQDCVAGAAHLIRTGQVDGRRTIITGSSAGGYTVLSALAFADIFRAGCSAYGIGDLQALAQDTHKFESRYLDQLLGPYPAEKTRYHARSPQYHAHKIACPVLFLQGGKDKIVPPQQAQEMCKALEDADQNAKLVLFAGEGHGFRQEQSIHDALLHELWFYADCFGFRAYDRRPQ